MKILQINKFHYLRGGSERYYLDLSEQLKDGGDEVMFFSMKHDNNLPGDYPSYFADNVNFQKASVKDGLKFVYNWNAVKNLKKLLKKEKPDIAHLHNIAHQLTPQIIEVLKENNIPVVQTLHDYKLICPSYTMTSKNGACDGCKGGKYYRCILNRCMHGSYAKSVLATIEAYFYSYKKTYEKVDLFIAPSRYMKEACVRFGIPEDKIKVLNNFIDPERFRTESVCKNHDNYLLYFGRLSKEKGVHVLIKAMSEVKNYRLKIVGAGPEYSQLKKMVSDSGLEDRIEFCGPKYGDELKKIINCAQAVIVPSVWPENFPYTILESLSCRKPVIATDIGGIPEMIDKGKNGFLFKLGDSYDLALKINKLGELSKENIKKFSDAKINTLDKNKHLKDLKKIYKSVIK